MTSDPDQLAWLLAASCIEEVIQLLATHPTRRTHSQGVSDGISTSLALQRGDGDHTMMTGDDVTYHRFLPHAQHTYRELFCMKHAHQRLLTK